MHEIKKRRRSPSSSRQNLEFILRCATAIRVSHLKSARCCQLIAGMRAQACSFPNLVLRICKKCTRTGPATWYGWNTRPRQVGVEYARVARIRQLKI